MADLTFFFDPLCPWTWRASAWIREVQRQRPLSVDWRFFSLAENNGFPGDALRAPLRVAALARREGGNDLVGRVYRGIGHALHESGVDSRDPQALLAAIPTGLQAEGLDPALAARAMADSATWDDVLADQRLAKDRYQAYAVPWLVREHQPFGFNGPILSEVPRGETATALWDHLSWLYTQPYLYEIKRERP